MTSSAAQRVYRTGGREGQSSWDGFVPSEIPGVAKRCTSLGKGFNWGKLNGYFASTRNSHLITGGGDTLPDVSEAEL
ncbi:MAG TPA: hypothetical protein VG297_18135 [Bryobacteraceae bacterium]|nr:hypothetical protein [Bryobacteraceae bacterium]